MGRLYRWFGIAPTTLDEFLEKAEKRDEPKTATIALGQGSVLAYAGGEMYSYVKIIAGKTKMQRFDSDMRKSYPGVDGEAALALFAKDAQERLLSEGYVCSIKKGPCLDPHYSWNEFSS